MPLGEGFLEENLVSQLHFQRLGYHRVRVVWTAPVYSDRGLKAFFYRSVFDDLGEDAQVR